MSVTAIDQLTTEFYDNISFENGLIPDIDSLQSIFHGDGLLINNSDKQMILYTAESLVQELESKVALGETNQFNQHEIYSRTELFGKIAQRISVYERSFSDYQQDQMIRGINFIQYVLIDESWKITSMVWNDENEDYQVPVDYLGK